jgi:hypothetical protein
LLALLSLIKELCRFFDFDALTIEQRVNCIREQEEAFWDTRDSVEALQKILGKLEKCVTDSIIIARHNIATRSRRSKEPIAKTLMLLKQVQDCLAEHSSEDPKLIFGQHIETLCKRIRA